MAIGARCCCMRSWRGCWRGGCLCLGGGLALHQGRGGSCVVGSVGVRVAALASPFERSNGAAVRCGWWSVLDGGWEARRRSAALPATSLECEPPTAGGFHHDSGSRIVVAAAVRVGREEWGGGVSLAACTWRSAGCMTTTAWMATSPPPPLPLLLLLLLLSRRQRRPLRCSLWLQRRVSALSCNRPDSGHMDSSARER